MMRGVLTGLVVLLCAQAGISQKKRFLTRSLQIENDNDAYTLNLTRDQYYSNGVAIRYRVLRDSTPANSKLLKVIRSYDINHRIYTPKRLWWTEVEQLDRPYAGQMSLSASNQYYYKRGAFLKAKAELGWMGPVLKTADLQYHWHKTFGMQLPLAWQYEINNGPIINAYGTYASTLAAEEGVDLTIEPCTRYLLHACETRGDDQNRFF